MTERCGNFYTLLMFFFICLNHIMYVRILGNILKLISYKSVSLIYHLFTYQRSLIYHLFTYCQRDLSVMWPMISPTICTLEGKKICGHLMSSSLDVWLCHSYSSSSTHFQISSSYSRCSCKTLLEWNLSFTELTSAVNDDGNDETYSSPQELNLWCNVCNLPKLSLQKDCNSVHTESG